MNRILLFPAGENRLIEILKGIYNIIPISNSMPLQDYVLLSDVLVIDVSASPQKAVETANKAITEEGFGVVVYIDKKNAHIEDEFLKLGVSAVIKEGFPADIIQKQIDSVIKRAQEHKEILKRRMDMDINKRDYVSIPAEKGTDISMEIMKRREFLKSFSRFITAGLDIAKLLDAFVDVMQEMLKVSRIALFFEEEGLYKIKAERGIPAGLIMHFSFSVNSALTGYLKKEGTALRIGDRHFVQPQIRAELEALGLTALVPLWEHGRLIGIAGFNNKITGSPLTDEEIELIFELGSQLALGIENTKLIEITSRQQEFMENILNHASSGIISINTKHIVIAYNPMAEEILGVPRDKVLNKNADSLPVDISRLLEESVLTGKIWSRKELKLRYIDKTIGASITPIMPDQGKITGAVMIFTDLQPLKQLEEERRRADKLEFTRTVAMRSSHELKNSMVSIKTFAQLLPERYTDKQFREDFYLVMNKEVDRLNQLVENLLFFAQPMRLEYSQCNIGDVIEDVTASLEKEDVLIGVKITKDIDTELGRIHIDRAIIMRAIKAVLYNSIQAMPKGGTIHIAASAVSMDKKQFLGLKIIDHGIGIPSDLATKVWEPFFTTKTKGIGLGMTIIRRIVEAHSGSLKLISQPDKGTEMHIYLPMDSSTKPVDVLYFPSGRKVVV